MIRGMSYPQGVFFMNKDHIAHATIMKNGEINTKLLPFSLKGLLYFMGRTLRTIPIYFVLLITLSTIWVSGHPSFPFYILMLLAFGYHFMFPYPLKQYHGAEHKVFSYRGKKTLEALEQVRQSDIVNRNCSTNASVTFFFVFLLGWFPLGGNVAAIVALFGIALIPRLLKSFDQKVLFPISAFFQRHITTVEPETRHLEAALLAFISLIRKEAVSTESLQEEQRLQIEKQQYEVRERRIRETEYREI